MLTKETTVRITIGSIVTVLVLLVGAVAFVVGEWNEYQRHIDRLDNVRNRVWVIEHPNDPWSLKYREHHPEID